jgi:hypothetical protein
VVEATIPNDRTLDGVAMAREWALEDVGDALAFVDDVGDTGARECTEVVRLAAGSRIEGGLIEVDATSVVRDFDDACLELRAI